MSDFVHLHLHTEFSLLDGACRIKSLPESVKAHGQKAVAISDHGNMFGVMEFYTTCIKEEIKPLIGCEVYVAKRSRFNKKHDLDSEIGHLVLIAENNTGYQNLIYLVSAAYTEGFYSKPRIDLDLLTSHSDGLIALSACLSGFVQIYLMNNDMDGAVGYIKKMSEIMGKDNFFLEIQNHYLQEQLLVNQKLLLLSRQLGIGLVATNDVHYINKDDAEAQAILICIQTNRTISDNKPLGFETSEFYLKSTEEMIELFADFDDAISNTVRIADRCEVNFDFGKTYLPEYKPQNKMTPVDFLWSLSYNGLKEYQEKQIKLNNPINIDIYKKRLEYELGIITKMGYADYYLIVWDFINYAKSVSIPVGPGRGSGAGSLCAYMIGITDIDPIKYNLLFERFLNPERISMPDFDIDLCQDRRSEVIDYVINKYGADKTAHIITFGTMAARGVVRDVGRVMGLNYSDVDSIAKMIPRDIGITLDKALEQSKELRSQYENVSYVKSLIDMSKKLEGMPRHSSTHAAGMVITQNPVYEYVPLALSSELVVTQFDMNMIAELGLLKIDFLGLRYLTIIENTIREIKKYNENFNIDTIPINDREVYLLLSSGNTDGIFQFESGGMKNLLMALHPEHLEDLIAAISLFRPGPMDSIQKYVKNRHNKKLIAYKIPELKEILDVTYGCIVYQEQVMQIFRLLAGYSYGQADIIRRAMSKKKTEVMEEEREYFLYGKKDKNGNVLCKGCIANGIREEYAVEIFDEMADFAKYAFNKSHAAAYALVSYRTAYLKCHYKKEFFAALLSSVLIDTVKLGDYVTECIRCKLKIYPPDINYSDANFTITDDGIRYGLMAIKNVGLGFIKNIVSEREKNGIYESFADFLYRIINYDVNKRQIEALIKCGVFDMLGVYRSKILFVFEDLFESLLNERRRSLPGQIDIFSSEDIKNDGKHFEFFVDYPDINELTLTAKLRFEKEAAGRFFSGHPLDEYSMFINKYELETIDYINKSFEEDSENDLAVNTEITVPGIITSIKIKQTKKSEQMAFISFEDEFSQIEVIAFPKKMTEFNDQLKTDAIVAIRGKVTVDRDEKPKIILDSIIAMIKNTEMEMLDDNDLSVDNDKNLTQLETGEKTIESKPTEKKVVIYLKIDNIENPLYDKILTLINIFNGKHEIKIYEEKTKNVYTDSSVKVSLDNTFITELNMLLGNDNVKIVER